MSVNSEHRLFTIHSVQAIDHSLQESTVAATALDMTNAPPLLEAKLRLSLADDDILRERWVGHSWLGLGSRMDDVRWRGRESRLVKRVLRQQETWMFKQAMAHAFATANPRGAVLLSNGATTTNLSTATPP